MEYKVENLSSVKSRIDVEIPASEVNSTLAATANSYKNSIQIPGFRKGKVPMPLIEKRFHDEIYNEARQKIYEENVEELLTKIDLHPLSGFVIKNEDKPIEKDQIYRYSFEFEHLPKFELPEYKGLSVEQTKVIPNPAAVDQAIMRLKKLGSKLVRLDTQEPPKEGQIANINFEIVENGEIIKDHSANDFDLDIGSGLGIPDLETLVKGTPVGHTTEKEITFEPDFADKVLAGKTVTLRIKVNHVSEYDFSTFDKIVEKNNNSYEQLVKTLEDSYKAEMEDINASVAKQKLLDSLLKMTDFELPEIFLEFEIDRALANMEQQLKEQGKSIKALGKTIEELKEQVKPQAEQRARGQTFLMAVADKENLEVSDEDVAQNIYDNCQRSGHNFYEVVDSMKKNGLIYRLKNNLLADKAMDFIYDKANVTFVDPPSKDENIQASENKTEKESEHKIAVQESREITDKEDPGDNSPGDIAKSE